jgi:acyl-coenzyme A thioesterase PaaI-like protein
MTDAHFLAAMAIAVDYDERGTKGSAMLVPSMWPTWSRRPRLAILASFVDVIAGHLPDAPVNPTVDLRVQVTGPVPETGLVEMTGRALRIGRRLVVAETSLVHEGKLFAVATTTFVNKVIGTGPMSPGGHDHNALESYEKLVDAKVVDERTIEVESTPQLSNGFAGTIQGGVQAFVAELAAEHLLDPGAEAVDLDIRYLNRMEVGPLRAEAHSTGNSGGLEAVRVRLFDAGNDDRTVSYVSLLMSQPV